MEWTSEGVILGVKPYGESDALVDAFTEEKGLACGFVKGGLSKRQRANIQPGNRVRLTWRARLETNLGRFTVELLHSPLGNVIGDGARLTALQTLLVVCQSVLQERIQEEAIYDAFSGSMALIENDASGPNLWGAALARMELMLLASAGFGLDLSSCAATGETQNLIYVSPKSGRAVCEAAGEPYKDKLLKLPSFMRLTGVQNIANDEARDALEMTGFFLMKEIWSIKTGCMPEARARFLSSLEN